MQNDETAFAAEIDRIKTGTPPEGEATMEALKIIGTAFIRAVDALGHIASEIEHIRHIYDRKS